jgi:hypothetical protein
MEPLPLATLAEQIESAANEAWAKLAGQRALTLQVGVLRTMSEAFVGHQQQLRESSQGATGGAAEKDVSILATRVAEVVERTNVLWTWREQIPGKKGNGGAAADPGLLGNIAPLEEQRTGLMTAVNSLATAARQVLRALENPPAITADSVGDGNDGNREAS